MISDYLLFDASAVFFGLWTLIISAVTIAVFGRDLLPAKAPIDSSPRSGRPASPASQP